MTTTIATPIGRPTGGRSINLNQLQAELQAAGVSVSALGMVEEFVNTYDAEGIAIDFDVAQQPAVDAAIAAHIALRDVTDAEYSAEFQLPTTTAVRRQQIRDITAGLLPREQVRIDNGLPLEDPAPEEDPLAVIKGVPLGSTTDELRDALVAYLERFGG